MFLRYFVRIGLIAYVLLNVADWALTYTLLRAHSEAIESNPVAAACLKGFGWSGLAFYKAATVLVFGTAVYLLARRRPPVAAGVVTFGVVVLVTVNFYSHNLLAAENLAAQQRLERIGGCEDSEEMAPADPGDTITAPLLPELPDAATTAADATLEHGPATPGNNPELVPPTVPVVTIRNSVRACGEEPQDSAPPAHGRPSH